METGRFGNSPKEQDKTYIKKKEEREEAERGRKKGKVIGLVPLAKVNSLFLKKKSPFST